MSKLLDSKETALSTLPPNGNRLGKIIEDYGPLPGSDSANAEAIRLGGVNRHDAAVAMAANAAPLQILPRAIAAIRKRLDEFRAKLSEIEREEMSELRECARFERLRDVDLVALDSQIRDSQFFISKGQAELQSTPAELKTARTMLCETIAFQSRVLAELQAKREKIVAEIERLAPDYQVL